MHKDGSATPEQCRLAAPAPVIAEPGACKLCDAEQPMAKDGNHHDMGGGVRVPCKRAAARPETTAGSTLERIADDLAHVEPKDDASRKKLLKAQRELEALAAARASSGTRDAREHIANEWADMATNGVQWLRNVRDGISTPGEALKEMESNHVRIRALAAATPAVTGAPPPCKCGHGYFTHLTETTNACMVGTCSCLYYERGAAAVPAEEGLREVRLDEAEKWFTKHWGVIPWRTIHADPQGYVQEAAKDAAYLAELEAAVRAALALREGETK